MITRLRKEIKKFSLLPVLFFFAATACAQPSIQGSINKGSANTTAEIRFKSNYTNAAGEYINYFQFSVSIPAAGNAGVTASAVAVNNFQDMGNLLLDGPYTEGSEIVFNFGYLNPAPPSVNHFAWTNGIDFLGVVVTFTGGNNNTAPVKMIDLTNDPAGPGGVNQNSYFGIVTNTGDKTNYPNLFYPIPGSNSIGTNPNGDQFVQTANPVVLAVSLLEFNGFKNGSRNELRWTTTDEHNNMGFVIQRSTDQVHFDSIGYTKSLAPGGNYTGKLNYAFTDNDPNGLTQYYRLNVKDLNSIGKYSNVIMLKGQKPTFLSVDEIYPNPVHTKLNLRINSPVSAPLNIVVTDVSGKKLSESKISAVIGYNLFNVMVDHLPAGVYMVHVISDNEEITKKFIRE